MYDFGLSDEQFWALTPAQFSALSDRFDDKNRREDFRNAHVISVMCNLHGRGKDDPPYTPHMFMPDYDGEDKPSSEMTAEDMLAHLKAAFPPKPPEAHGG